MCLDVLRLHWNILATFVRSLTCDKSAWAAMAAIAAMVAMVTMAISSISSISELGLSRPRCHSTLSTDSEWPEWHWGVAPVLQDFVLRLYGGEKKLLRAQQLVALWELDADANRNKNCNMYYIIITYIHCFTCVLYIIFIYGDRSKGPCKEF